MIDILMALKRSALVTQFGVISININIMNDIDECMADFTLLQRLQIGS
jgi:hypothetical protein